jgi:hypothetical protein
MDALTRKMVCQVLKEMTDEHHRYLKHVLMIFQKCYTNYVPVEFHKVRQKHRIALNAYKSSAYSQKCGKHFRIQQTALKVGESDLLQQEYNRWISGSHADISEKCYLMGCGAVQPDKSLPMFRRNTMLPSSISLFLASCSLRL